MRYLFKVLCVLFLISNWNTLSAQRSLTIGSAQQFNATTSYDVNSSKIDDTHILIVFKDGTSSTSNDLKAVIAEVDSANKTISYGTVATIVTDAFRYGTPLVLSSTQAVIAYEEDAASDFGEALVLTLNTGTNTIDAIGTPATFESGDVDATFSHNTINMVKLSSTTFAIAYADANDDGLVKIGTVSGSSLSFGSSNTFNSGDITNISMSALSSSKIILTYEVDDNSDIGETVVGTISGTSVSFGTPVTFESSTTVSYTSVTAISSTVAVVCYVQDLPSDYLWSKVLTVSGSSITVSTNADSIETSQDARDLNSDYLQGNEFIIAFNGGFGDNSKVRIGEVNGTGSSAYVTYGTAITFYAGEADNSDVQAINDNTIVISYVQDDAFDEGMSIVGTLPSASSPPSVSASTTSNASCNGYSDGSITATITGGTANFTYSWSNGATTSNTSSTTNSITSLSSGTYTVTITDNNGLTATASAFVNQPSSLNATATSSSNVSCNGGSDGSASASGSGGTSPYTYTWSNGSTSSANTGLTAGTYTLTITDNNGCTATNSTTITEPSALSANPTTNSNVSVNGGSDGIISASPSGGTSPYTYAWSTGNASSFVTSLSAGTYTITVTDNNGCTNSGSTIVTQPAAAVAVSISNNTSVSCNGFSDGSLTASASSGTSPYTYAWSNGATTATASNLPSATYTITVSDNAGSTATASAFVSQPSSLYATATSSSNVSCNGGSDGSASASGSGGTSPYTYVWSNGSTSSSNTGLIAGTYTLTITDNNGCTATNSTVISQPSSAITIGLTTSNVSCNGFSNGGINSSVSGGSSPYTYAWSDGSTTSNISSSSAGTYTLTVTDNSGCTNSNSATITEPATFVASAVTDSNVTCNGFSDGGATASGTGGTMPYTYSWNNGATTASITGVSAAYYYVTISDNNGCTDSASVIITEPASLNASAIVDSNVTCNGFSDGGGTANASGGTMPYTYIWSNSATTASITGVTAGTYTTTVTDNNGCTSSSSLTITEPALLIATASTTQNVTVNGGFDGEATSVATGGTAPYTYLWSNSATTATFVGVGAGTYTVTITDNNGCTDTDNTVITEPAPSVSVSITSINHVACYNQPQGSMTASAVNGTTPYTYLWSNSATTASINGLYTGTYTVTVTDNSGTTATASAFISQPSSSLSATSTSSSNATCNGTATGSASTSATGGTSPYTYSWSNGVTSASNNNISAGTYTVTITDNNGCTTTSMFSISEPSSMNLSTSSTDANCNGESSGSITAFVSGGNSPYTYVWNDGSTTATASSLLASTYTVTVTDNLGCTISTSGTVNEPSAVTASAVADSNATCSGFSDGGATASATGGNTPYTYLWSNGATTASITGISAGTYTTTITDNHGCTATDFVTITQPSFLAATISQTAQTCPSADVGILTASGSGGTSPYTYLWSNGTTSSTNTGLATGTYTVTITDNNGCTSSSSESVSSFASPVANFALNPSTGNSLPHTVFFTDQSTLPDTWMWSFGDGASSTAQNPIHTYTSSGTFYVTLTVTDTLNGCTSTKTDSVFISQVAVSISASTNISCNGLSDGSITAAVSIGTSPLTYSWSNGSTATTSNTTDTKFNLAAGTYTVTVTDNTGATATASTTLTEPTVLAASTSGSTNVSCNGGSDGTATASGSGGTAPYTYLWSTGQTSATATSLVDGVYTATITDNNGCTAVTNATITEPNALSVNIPTVNNVSCNGFSDGGLNSSASGGTSPYTYAWSDGSTTANISNVSAGTYTITITDNNACTAVNSAIVTEPTSLAASATVSNNVSCNGLSDGLGNASASGGTSPYTYSWSNGATTASLSNVSAGTYTVTVTDNNACTSTDNLSITEPASLIASAAVDSNVTCNGFADGGGTASATGGTSPYTYLWSNSATTASITGVLSGTYSVTITDANACTDSASIVISQPNGLVASAVVDSNASCNGFSDGGATASGTGGTMPYTYLWSNAATTASITGIAAGTYTVTISDNQGCSDVSSANITEPAILQVTTAVDSNASCLGFTDGGGSTTVTGGTSPYTYSWSNGSSAIGLFAVAEGSYTVTVTDANACTTSGSLTITVVDTIKPNVITQNISVYLDNNGNASITTGDLDNGSSDACGSPTLSLSNSSFNCSNLGANNVQLIATDVNGNIDSNLAVVTVLDTVKPIMISQNINAYLDANGQATITAAAINNGSSDNCTTLNLSLSKSTFNCSEVGANTIQLIGTDGSNNVRSVNATVTVLDTLNPLMSSQNISVYLDANGSVSITSSDIDNGSSDNCGNPSLSLSQSSFGCSETGANTIQLIGTDANNNIDSTSAVVTVLDSIKPQISSCPANISQNIDAGTCTAIVSWVAPTAADNCNVDSLVSSHMPGDVFSLGVTTVTYIAYDPAMNTDTCRFTITISDNEAPVISGIPADISQNNDLGNCDAVVTWTLPTAADNCTLDSLVSNYNSGDVFPVGTTKVIYTAYDAAMNTSSDSFNIVITDNEKPVVICPSAINQCDSIVSFTDPIPTDNCPGVTIVRSDVTGLNSGDEFPIGITNISYLATDAYGNQEVCDFNVNVYTPPVAHAGPDLETRDIEPIKIKSSATNVGTVSWFPFERLDNENTVSPIANPQVTTEYIMTVISPDGCTDTDSMTINVNVVTKLDATTLFSPNGDGINDTWVVNKPALIEGCRVIIVNRNGTEVYNKTNYNNDWDASIGGEQLPEGTYYYIIDCPDGRTFNGPISVIREKR